MSTIIKDTGIEFPDGTTQTTVTTDNINGSLSTGFQSNSLTSYYSAAGEFPGTVSTICNLGNGIVLIGTSRTRTTAFSENYGLIYRSIDYGQNWTNVFKGTLIDNFDNFDTYSEECTVIENCGKGIVLAGFGGSNGDAQILKSFDFGQTWEFSPNFSLNQELSGSADPDSYFSIKSIKYLGDGWVILGTGYNKELYTLPKGHATIWYSSDYGKTWIKNTSFSSSIKSVDSIEYFYEIPTNTHRIVLGVENSYGGIQILHSSVIGSDRLYANTNFSLFTNDYIDGSEVNVIKNIGGTVGLFGTDSSLYKFDLKDTQSGPTYIDIGVNTGSAVNDIEYCGQGRVVLALTNPISFQPGILVQSNDYGETFEDSSIQHTMHGETSFISLRYLGQDRLLAGSDLDGNYPVETGYVYVGTPPTPKGRTFYPFNTPIKLDLLSTEDTSFSSYHSEGWHYIGNLPSVPPNSIYVARVYNEGTKNLNISTFIVRPIWFTAGGMSFSSADFNFKDDAHISPVATSSFDIASVAGDTRTHNAHWEGLLIEGTRVIWPAGYDPVDTAETVWEDGIFVKSFYCTISELVLLGYYA